MFVNKKGPAKYIAHAAMILFSILCIIPFLIVVSISFSSAESIQHHGYQIIPSGWSTLAYRSLLAEPDLIVNAYSVNIYVTVIGTILALFVTVLTAYVLSRRSYVLRRPLNFYMFFTMIFSGGMVPLYILMTRYLGLKDSLWSIILLGLVVPGQIFMLRTFFQEMPEALIEAAKIDGASETTVLFKIVVPMNTGAIATILLMVILGFWNDWYRCMLYITKPKLYNLQYMLQVMMGKAMDAASNASMGLTTTEEIPQDSMRMALCIFAAGPTILVFPFFQKYFVAGLSSGAVKG